MLHGDTWLLLGIFRFFFMAVMTWRSSSISRGHLLSTGMLLLLLGWLLLHVSIINGRLLLHLPLLWDVLMLYGSLWLLIWLSTLMMLRLGLFLVLLFGSRIILVFEHRTAILSTTTTYSLIVWWVRTFILPYLLLALRLSIFSRFTVSFALFLLSLFLSFLVLHLLLFSLSFRLSLSLFLLPGNFLLFLPLCLFLLLFGQSCFLLTGLLLCFARTALSLLSLT